MLAAQLSQCNKGALVKSCVSLGNDGPTKYSSYQTDYCIANMHRYDHTPCHPPKPAQIITQLNPGAEKDKWMSSTTRDFCPFGADVRSKVYQQSKKDRKATIALMTEQRGFVADKSISHVTSNGRDFTERNCFHHPPMPQPEVYIHKVPLSQSCKRRVSAVVIPEAKDSYQWPSQDRIHPFK